MKTNIVLYGFMGAGKSTVGEQLAKTYELKLMDTDRILESQEGVAVEEIFRVKGENYFRGIERDVVRALAQRDGLIIATGGGVPLDRSNVDQLAEKGLGIYLRANARTLAKRLEGSTGRPLLVGGSEFTRIEMMLRTRTQAYARIPNTIDTDRLTVPEISRKVWQLFDEVRTKGPGRHVRV